MRIWQIVHCFPPYSNAGAEKYTYQLSTELAQRHEVHVTYPILRNVREPARRLGNGIHVHELRPAALRNALNAIRLETSYQRKEWEPGFRRLLEELQPDVVHFQHLLNMSVQFVHLTGSLGIPSVVTLHDYWFLCPTLQLLRWDGKVCSGPEPETCRFCWTSYRSRTLAERMPGLLDNASWLSAAIQRILLQLNNPSAFERRIYVMQELLREMDVVIAPSRFLWKVFASHFDGLQALVHLEHGYGANLESSELCSAEGRSVVFGFLGRIVPTKGLHVLLEAFIKIPEDKAELVIYGDCDQGSPYVQALVDRTRGSRNIHFRGHTTDIQGALSAMDVLVFPSIWYENCPLVLAERRLVGRPVIASNLGAIPEFVSEDDGYLFEPGDTEDLYRKMMIFVDNPRRANEQSISISAIPRTMEEHARELEELYSMLVKKEERCQPTPT